MGDHSLGFYVAVKIGLEIGFLFVFLTVFSCFLSPKWIFSLASKFLYFVTIPAPNSRDGYLNEGESASVETSALLSGGSSSNHRSNLSSAHSSHNQSSPRIFDRHVTLQRSLLLYLRIFVGILIMFGFSLFTALTVYRETTFATSTNNHCFPSGFICFSAYQNDIPLVNTTHSALAVAPESNIRSLLYYDFNAMPLSRAQCSASPSSPASPSASSSPFYPGIPASYVGPVDILCFSPPLTWVDWAFAAGASAALSFWVLGGGFSLLTFFILLFANPSSSSSSSSSASSNASPPSKRHVSCSRMQLISFSLLIASLTLAIGMLSAFAVSVLSIFEVCALLYLSLALFVYSLMLMTSFRVFDGDVRDDADELTGDDLDDLSVTSNPSSVA